MDSGQAATSNIAQFSTESFDARDQFDAWGEYLRMRFGPAEVSRSGIGAFRGTAETVVLRELAVSCIAGDPMAFERTARHAERRAHDGYTAGLLVEGRAVVEQDGNRARLYPDDLI